VATETFYQKFLAFFFRSVIVIVLFLGAAQLLLLFVANGEIGYYWSFGVMLSLSLTYLFKFCIDFRGFQESANQGLFDPVVASENRSWNKGKAEAEPLNIETEDMALKVCVAYAEDKNFYEIKKEFNFRDATRAKRELQKGLTMLLKEHEAKQ
jgi:hypothetical protein